MPAVKYIDVPDQAAIDFLKGKANITTRAWDDLQKQVHAKAFTVAGATKLALLKDIRAAVESAIENGESISKFRKRFDQAVNDHGWEYNGKRGWRTRVIYDTNIRTARMAGRWDKLQQNKEHRPYLMYRTAGDERVRDKHKQWHQIILPVDHPFWKTFFPPNGWGCRCGVRTVSQRDMDRNGWKVSSEDQIQAFMDDKTSRINHVTGEDYGEVPNGIDVGWDYNVGIAWKNADTAKQLKAHKKTIETSFKDTLKTYKNKFKVAPSAFSTVDGVGAKQINDVLSGLTAAKPQFDKLSEFMDKKEVKSLFVKQSEMGFRNKASRKIAADVNEYLGDTNGVYNYTISKPTRVGGFTSVVYNHVVVKAATKHRINNDKAEEIREDILKAVDKVFESGDQWTTSSSSKLDAAQVLMTWIHEIGHQVHYWAESPLPPRSAVKMTRYSHTNKYEYHAEHFVLWLLNRKKLNKIDPIAAEHFDNLIEKAIKSNIKKR